MGCFSVLTIPTVLCDLAEPHAQEVPSTPDTSITQLRNSCLKLCPGLFQSPLRSVARLPQNFSELWQAYIKPKLIQRRTKTFPCWAEMSPNKLSNEPKLSAALI